MSISAPTRTDPVARAFSPIAGGPVGRFLRRGSGPWQALPVLVLLTALTMVGAVLSKQHCRDVGWSTPDQFWHACYSDTAVLYSSSALGGPQRPSLYAALGGGPGGLGQAPLPGALMWLVSGAVHAVSGTANTAPDQAQILEFFDVSAVVMALVLFIAVAATTMAVGPRRRWDGAQVALAPIVVTVGLLSYELVTTMFVALSLWAWSRRRPALTGVFVAAAIGSRPVSALLLVALLAVCLRAGQVRAWSITAGMTLLGWLAIRILFFRDPFSVVTGAWSTWRNSGPGYGSLWLIPQLLDQNKPANTGFWYSGGPVSNDTSSALTLIALIAIAIATVLLALTTRYRPRLAHLALFSVALGLLAVKAFPPQAALILLPLLAASALPWRDHLIWATTEIVYFVGVWMYIAASSDPNRGLPGGFYLALILVRAAGVLWVAAQALRLARRPVLDPARVSVDPLEGPIQDDDAGGGVVDSRPAWHRVQGSAPSDASSEGLARL